MLIAAIVSVAILGGTLWLALAAQSRARRKAHEAYLRERQERQARADERAAVRARLDRMVK